MRIESILVKNFRQYNSVEIKFPKNRDTDLHIILGSNGVGKTNILNAITWCLYDEELHLGDVGAALPILNTVVSNDLRTKGIKTADVEVSINLSSEESNSRIAFKRVAVFAINTDNVFKQSSKLQIKLFERGEWSIYDDPEITQSLINKYVPKSINEYIFFDGEHLEHYFQQGQRENIKIGINTLTQADIVKRAEESFDRYVKKELNPVLANCDDKQVEQCQNKVDGLRNRIQEQIDVVNAIKDQIKVCDEEIAAAKAIVQHHEVLPKKIEEQEKLDQDIRVAQEKRDRKWAEIKTFSREFYQLFALYPAIKQFFDFIKVQEKEGKLPPRIDKNLIEEILHSGQCCICNNTLDSKAKKLVQEMLDSLDISSNVSAELNRSMTAMQAFETKLRGYKQRKESLFSELNSLDKNIENLMEDYKTVTLYINSIPNQDKIVAAVNSRNEYVQIQKDCLVKQGAEELTLEGLKKDLENAKKDLERALSNNTKLLGIKEQIAYCESCSKILSETYNEILEECRNDMEKMTYDIFSKLIWKKDTFKEVQITEDYEFKLMNKYGDQTLGSCSAAERALLALSFTLALQYTSKHDAMLFIDTPIGRVDEDNRCNFIKTLLDIAKDKQVILTFTPTEYDSNVRELLSGKCSTSTALSMNNDITETRSAL